MFTSRFVALTAAASLVGLPLVPNTAAASPWLVKLHAEGELPAGYAPAGEHEVLVEAVPVPEAPPAPPEPAVEAVVVSAPAVEPYADPSLRGPATTTVIVAAPPAPAAPVRRAPPPPPKRGLGLMIAGFSMFGTAYMLTAWAGALAHDGHGGCNRTDHQCREMGKALMVPFFGPIMASQDSESARETFGLFLVSGIQIATFAMGLVGAVRYSRFKRWERNFAGIPLGKRGLAVQPMPRLDGAALGLNYRF